MKTLQHREPSFTYIVFISKSQSERVTDEIKNK